MATGRVLVYGGRGALGSVIVDQFKSKGFWVVSVDLSASDAADANITVDSNASWVEQEAAILKQLAEVLADNKLDALLCVAGGWAGGSAASADMVRNADLMWKQSVWSSTISVRAAALHLKSGGLVQLTGAAPAVEGTPSMIGYGMAKAAVHQLTRSLASPDGGLPDGATVLALLPVTLDTPMNRKWMPKADHSTWTPLSFVAEQLLKWTQASTEERPPSGSLVRLTTQGGKTELANL